jgi:phenylacetate-CoA ligase
VTLPRSSIRGIDWPPLPDPRTAQLFAMLWQLEQTEWWEPEDLAAMQAVQLRTILHHAVTTTDHYARLDRDDWATVPVMSRAEIIAAGAGLESRDYPAEHGKPEDQYTSRSSGAPVRVRMNGVVNLFWKAITLRDHFWHGRDLTASLATIRYVPDAPPPEGRRGRSWGPSTAWLAPDAPLSVLSIKSTLDVQVAWFLRQDPVYLLTYPSVLHAMVLELQRTGQRPTRLAEIRTVSERLSPDTRALVREVLGVPIVDAYSAQEVGYIALQCPEHEHYHVMSERLLVEVLDEHGAPCKPGEIGRVVLTDLHNFATPILRYEIGDHAEVGERCPCGRGLPVLRRIMGRTRNMLTYPDGRQTWPLFTIPLRDVAHYRELQLVQLTVDTLRLRVATDRLDDAERAAMVQVIHRMLEHPFEVEIEVVDELSRGPTGKLEEFISHVSAAPRM